MTVIEVFVECNKEITTDVQLVVRHGTYFELRNVTWHVSISDATETLLGRPVLEARGINTKDLLAAVADKMGESTHILSLLSDTQYPKVTVARIMHDRVYHSNKGVEENTHEIEDASCLDLGTDAENKFVMQLKKTCAKLLRRGFQKKVASICRIFYWSIAMSYVYGW